MVNFDKWDTDDKDKADKSGKKGKNEKDGKEPSSIFINKYTQNLHRKRSEQILHEAVFVAGLPVFLKKDLLGDIKMVYNVYEPPSLVLEPDTMLIVKPPQRGHFPSTEYSFEDAGQLNAMWQTMKTLTIDDMFEMSRHIWKEYVHAKPHVIDLLAANTIMSYFQDLFSTVFYIFIIGDNESGKGTILEVANQIIYRAYLAGSATDSVVYRNLGSIEGGQAIMLLDEANRLSPLQIEISKVGYRINSFVFRTEDIDNSKKPQKFYTYGQRYYAAETAFDGEGAKGLNERCFYVNAVRGKPKMTFSDVISPVNSNRYNRRLAELSNFRNMMLLYKLKHFSDSLPNFVTTYDGRSRELTSPMLSLFHDSKYLLDVINTLDVFIENRRKTKLESKEALLFSIVQRFQKVDDLKDLIDPGTCKVLETRANSLVFDIPARVILEMFKDESESEWKGIKKDGGEQPRYAMISNRYGEIGVNLVGGILRDRFGGRSSWMGPKGARIRAWTFSRETIDGLMPSYAEHTKLKILNVEDDIEEDYSFKK